jgi:hypothetical protein
MELIRAAAAASGKASIKFEARGDMRSNGYAGKIQIGVIVCIGNVLKESAGASRRELKCTDWVDHKIIYMPELAITLMETYPQKKTCAAVSNQTPVLGIPYWHRLINIVPILQEFQYRIMN